MDDVILFCDNCNCMVEEEHICDTDYNAENTEDINRNNTGHNDSDWTERLISEVFIREPLWNAKLLYKQRGPTDIKLLWSEIDTCLGTDPGTSQIKWKNLRDRFVKEHNIQNTYTASGSAAKVKKNSTWYLYETLSFLTPTICYRKTKSNLENMNPNKPSISSIRDLNFHNISCKQDRLQQIRYVTNNNFENMSQNCPSQDLASLNTNCTQKNLLQQSVLKPQSNNTPESPRTNEISSELNRNGKKRLISESEILQTPKSTKHMKKSNTPVDTRLEEALLRELEQTRPTKEQCQSKLDKIESFVKYIESCLRGITLESSKFVMNQILKILLEEDI